MAQPVTSDTGEKDRRQHRRYKGPFEGVRSGLLPTPLRIYDLSLGGCFITSYHEQQPGSVFRLEIDLPGEGRIAFTGETLYNLPGGYAVRFVDLDELTRKRLDRGLRNWHNP